MTITRGIDHIGITVPDIEAATTFFKKDFEAKIAYDNKVPSAEPLSGAEIEEVLGVAKGTKLSHVRLLVLEGKVTIELFKYDAENQKEPVIASDIGIQHIGFYVDNIHEATEKIKDAGGELLTPVHEILGDAENGVGDFVYFRTPWGSLMECIQYDESKITYPSDSEIERVTPDPAKDHD